MAALSDEQTLDLQTAERSEEPTSVHASGRGDAARNSLFRGGPMAKALASADVIGLMLAFAVAEIFAGRNEGGRLSVWQETILLAATLPVWLFFARLYGLYSRDRRSTSDEIVRIFNLTTTGTWLLTLLFWGTGSANPDFAKIAVFWLAATPLIMGTRIVVRTVLPRIMQTKQNVVIAGAGEAGQIVAKKLLAHDGFRLVCFLDPDPIKPSPELVDVPVLSTFDAFWELTRRVRVDRVVVSYSRQRDDDQLDLIHSLRTRGVRVDIVPRMFELLGEQTELHDVEGFLLLGLPPISLPGQSRVKRGFDIVVSFALLILLSPVFAVAALVVKLDSKGPVLYRSERIGGGGRRFMVAKFRTMRDGAEGELPSLLEEVQARVEFQHSHKLRNDPRVTRSGAWLRRSSLDELPQLFDVFRGRLSLVGPRPITVAEYEHFVLGDGGEGPWTGVRGYWEIPGLRPGLTGLWQVNGRSSIAYAERVRLDKVYLSNWSFRFDLLILAKTFRALAGRAGAS